MIVVAAALGGFNPGYVLQRRHGGAKRRYGGATAALLRRHGSATVEPRRCYGGATAALRRPLCATTPRR